MMKYPMLLALAAMVPLSLIALISTIALHKRMSDETADILFGFIPLELIVLFFGSPISLVSALCLFGF